MFAAFAMCVVCDWGVVGTLPCVGCVTGGLWELCHVLVCDWGFVGTMRRCKSKHDGSIGVLSPFLAV